MAGQKVFTLLPPCDSYRLYPVTVPASRFAAKEGKDGFDVVQVRSRVSPLRAAL